ncbi:MAG: glycosyltransferase, partial [Firmicutes bacterium]|nr:glycosyltransferase [Bacillota bacterium]
QETKNSSNSVILAGSNTLLRRSAVEAIGGFVTGTVTEDFSTGIELEKNGYTGVSIDEVLADGLPPMDFGSFVRQRRRWARGCIQSGRKTKYLKSKSLSLRQKVNYFSSIVYWYSSLKRLIYMVAPMLFCLAGIGVMRCEPWEIALFWFPFYACVHLCIYNFSDKIRSLRWTNIYETVLMPFLLPAVFKELFGFHQTIFDVTSKKQEAGSRRQKARFLAPFVFLLLLNILSLALIILRSFAEQGFHYVLLVVYLLVNFYYLITACRVVTGSAKYTEDPMFGIQEAMQYRDDLEEDFVNIRSTALNEDRISTGTYDDKWTAGVMRIPAAGDRPQIDIPVRYEKNGVWKIDKDAAAFDNYNEYVYHIFNR